MVIERTWDQAVLAGNNLEFPGTALSVRDVDTQGRRSRRNLGYMAIYPVALPVGEVSR